MSLLHSPTFLAFFGKILHKMTFCPFKAPYSYLLPIFIVPYYLNIPQSLKKTKSNNINQFGIKVGDRPNSFLTLNLLKNKVSRFHSFQGTFILLFTFMFKVYTFHFVKVLIKTGFPDEQLHDILNSRVSLGIQEFCCVCFLNSRIAFHFIMIIMIKIMQQCGVKGIVRN